MAVATSQPLAAQAGLEMLRRGGSAADAAVATAAAMTVLEPTTNGIGGDGFVLGIFGGEVVGLNASGRAPARIALVEKYAKAQGLFRTRTTPDPVFTDVLELDLAEVRPSMAGPKRPEGRVALENVASGFADALENEYRKSADKSQRYSVDGKNYDLGHGDVAIAAITSCTNTSNPSVLIGAGLLARNAVAKGLIDSDQM
jgi:hypothetical protein